METHPYLRLLTAIEPPSTDLDNDSNLDRLCRSLSVLTGWQLRRGERRSDTAVWDRPMSAGDAPREWLSVEAATPQRSATWVPQGLICELASYIHDLAMELQSLRQALRAREAELATAVPVVVDPALDGTRLADRLESVLRGGAEAIGAESAGLYLLDDRTEHLKLRAHWGLSESALSCPPRPLRTANADVEALVGHAIAIEDTNASVAWQVPQPCGAAVCVPVASATTLLGTLWAYHREPSRISDQQTNLWEIIAGRLAAELEREAVVRDRIAARTGRSPDRSGLSAVPLPVHDAFHGEGWAATTRVAACEMDRNVLVHLDGSSRPRLRGTAVAADADDELAGAILASQIFSRLVASRSRWLSARRYRRIHDQLFQQSTGDSFATAASWELDRETGELKVLSAGHVEAFIVRPHAWEPWIRVSAPLGDGTAKRLPRRWSTRLEPTDWLLLLWGAASHSLHLHNAPEIDGQHLAEALLRQPDLSIETAADALWRMTQHHRAVWRKPPSLMLLRRK